MEVILRHPCCYGGDQSVLEYLVWERRSGTCVKLAKARSFHSKSRAVDLISKAIARKIYGMVRSLYRNKSHTRAKSMNSTSPGSLLPNQTPRKLISPIISVHVGFCAASASKFLPQNHSIPQLAFSCRLLRTWIQELHLNLLGRYFPLVQENHTPQPI